MGGKTIITITNPAGTDTHTFKAFKDCNVQDAATSRISSFRFTVEAFDSSFVDRFPKGSDVQIWQGWGDNPQMTMRGWLNVPGKMLDARTRITEFSGVDYTGKLQYIIVTESYDGQTIDYIVKDLIEKYAPWASTTKVQATSTTIKKKFNREYLFEALEFLASIEGWEFYIDTDLDLNFFDPVTRINQVTLSQAKANYRRGSAQFTEDPRIINKLYVRGGMGFSEPYTETFKGDGARRIFGLAYKPYNVTVKLNGVDESAAGNVGINNIDSGKKFYINYQEKFIKHDSGQPVLQSTDTLDITYQYEYPILILLEDKISQVKYGVFEDKLDVQSDDKDLVKLKGMQHLAKYSNPLPTGSIEPLEGLFRAGELVHIDIPDLKVNGNYKISQVTHSSSPREYKQTLQLENDFDTRLVLKEIRNSIKRLQEQFEQDGPVEQILNLLENLRLTDTVSVIPPLIITEILTLTDQVSATTQNSGTFQVGYARVGFADVG
ncbi:XkdQ/YqbQ family protein [Thermincola ferriacetica]